MSQPDRSGGGDRITLRGLRLFGRHGVFEREREAGQEFVVDLVVWLDLSRAGQSDELAHTVDYGELAQHAADVAAGTPRRLIETVAHEIADGLLRGWPLHAVEVTVHKPAAPVPFTFEDVAVTVLRER